MSLLEVGCKTDLFTTLKTALLTSYLLYIDKKTVYYYF